MTTKRIQAFFAIIELAAARGAILFENYPWRTTVGRWNIYVNPHSTDLYRLNGSVVPPQTAYITFNGAPVGFISQEGGAFAPLGDATEDAFLTIITNATEAPT